MVRKQIQIAALALASMPLGLMGGLLVTASVVHAQTMTAPAAAHEAMLAGFESECVAVAKAMPADKYNFSPDSLKIPGAKYQGVYTFAGEVKHLTQANYYFYSQASGLKPDVDMKKLDTLTGKDEIVAALEASFAFGHKALATLTAANDSETIKPVDGIGTRGTLADFAVAHGNDHYGQMIEYLRMNGIVPPGSK